MRQDPLSNCEKTFITESLNEGLRLDNRTLEEFRPVKLIVGSQCGTALCSMGLTKVFCSVSAVLREPHKSKPHRGMIYVDVDMSPMGNPACEHNRAGERGMELTRLLELVLRDSRCVDTESLCVRAEKEVWCVRVDVKILDDDGSLLDCASVASVAALHHFRRPQVTVEPHHTIVHSQWEKPLIPLNIYHMPICVTFGFLENGKNILVDPTNKETQCITGNLVVACNKRKEVCALHQSTEMILTATIIKDCVNRAMQRVTNLSDLITDVIKDDSQKRAKYIKPNGFEVTITPDLLTSRESNPDELIAPSIELPEPKNFIQQNSVILNENPLTSDAMKQENDEDELIEKQVKDIAEGLDNRVQLNTQEQQRTLNEVADLLDGLDDDDDDLEGETMVLGS
ncbi:unnamed protein product [Auanema sp. JU1783]|nr:unnamed protein product [Auanema sp. JU1783]